MVEMVVSHKKFVRMESEFRYQKLKIIEITWLLLDGSIIKIELVPS